MLTPLATNASILSQDYKQILPPYTRKRLLKVARDYKETSDKVRVLHPPHVSTLTWMNAAPYARFQPIRQNTLLEQAHLGPHKQQPPIFYICHRTTLVVKR